MTGHLVSQILSYDSNGVKLFSFLLKAMLNCSYEIISFWISLAIFTNICSACDL